MPPRLSHKKTRTGCKRCKARKVKCDEGKPTCGACSRHNVPCEYAPSPYGDAPSPALSGIGGVTQADHMLELRLIHEWMAYTCISLTSAWEFWKFQAPLLAFSHRHLLDSMLAITALYASRQKPRYWSSLEGKMLPVNSPPTNTAVETGWKQASETRKAISKQPGADYIVPVHPDPNGDMLQISRRYFASALEGHQHAVANLNPDNFRTTFMSSILVCYYALFTLSEGFDESDAFMIDPMSWFKLCRGTTLIIDQWKAHAGERWFIEAGGMYGEPDLSDNVELFRPDHMEHFKYLLHPVGDDTLAEADRQAFEHTLSYIGLIYKGIVEHLDSDLAIGRRVIAMPARVPPRFGDLIESHHPRALAILAHAFACMQLAEERFPWFRGISQRQIPIICAYMPEGPWRELVRWPLDIIREKLLAVAAAP